MEFMSNLFGLHTDQLSLIQMLVRAATVYFASLVFIRIAGIRTLGSHATFDYITYVMLGAILGRGVVSASQPFFSSLAAVFLLIIIQRATSWLTFKSHRLGNLIKGKTIILIDNGKILEENLQKTHLTREDILESLHLLLQTEEFEKIRRAYLERSGDISIISEKQGDKK